MKILCYKSHWYNNYLIKDEPIVATAEELSVITGISVAKIMKCVKGKKHRYQNSKLNFEEYNLIENFMIESLKDFGNTVLSPNRLKFATLDEIINGFRENGYEVNIRAVEDEDGLYYVVERVDI